MNNKERVRVQMAHLLNQPVESFRDEVELKSVVHSSFALVEVIIELQDEFGVRFGQADMQGVTTVGDLIDLFAMRLGSG